MIQVVFRSFSDEATSPGTNLSRDTDGLEIGRDCSVDAWVESMTGSYAFHRPFRRGGPAPALTPTRKERPGSVGTELAQGIQC